MMNFKTIFVVIANTSLWIKYLIPGLGCFSLALVLISPFEMVTIFVLAQIVCGHTKFFEV